MTRSTGTTLCTAGLLMTAVLLGACASTPQVSTARSPEADFSTYRTFAFHDPLGTDRGDGIRTILSQTLMQQARQELEARGYRYDAAAADLEVNFFSESRQVVEGLNRPAAGVPYGIYHRYYGVWPDYETRIHQFTMGTLHIDVIDAARRQLVWEGIVQQRLQDEDFAFEAERLQDALREVFAGFPPSA